jgi:4-diphosphocytidyl-2-C-methyl-D-erythritol kinase
MAFADVGDHVSVRPADTVGLEINGPFAEGLEAGEDNLVLRAARAILARCKGPRAPFHLTLTKALPLAAGLGGGSSDAGAALRLLRDSLETGLSDAELEAVAGELGSDGPACLFARSVVAEGRGERLSPAPAFPILDAVLINPRVPSPTGAVYRGFDAMGAVGGADRPDLPPAFESAEEMAGFLATCRNDLEAPAVQLTPLIGEVLATLRDEPETLLARLSGSGATLRRRYRGRGPGRAAGAHASRLVGPALPPRRRLGLIVRLEIRAIPQTASF